MKKLAILFLALTMLLCGCTKTPAAETQSTQPSEADTPTPTQSAGDYFSNRDFETEVAAGAVAIRLDGNTAACDSSAVQIDGSTVTVTAEGTYVLTGSLSDGMIIVDVDKQAKVQLVLGGVSIHSETSAAIYIRQADKVFITLAEGTENTLSNGGSFEAIDDSSIDAALFSKEDVTLNGAGRLTVTSPAGHGLVSKDSLTVTGGTYVISSANHAMTGKDDVAIAGGCFALTAGKDGIHADNTDDETLGLVYITGGTFTIDAADDGIHASSSVTITGGTYELATGDDGIHAEDTLTVTGGTVNITESYEGLEALHILVQDGDITIVASDDGLNAAGGTDQSATQGGRDGAFGGNRPGGPGGERPGGPGGMGGGPGGMSAGNGSVTISGGTLHITASGDGIDANGTLTISGGYTTVCGPTRGDTATLDYDVSAVITGGTFIGTGASGMAQTFSDSEQGVIAVSVGNQAAGTQITLTDASGNVVVSHAPALSFGVVILSSPEVVKGESYTITVGDQSGTFEAS